MSSPNGRVLVRTGTTRNDSYDVTLMRISRPRLGTLAAIVKLGRRVGNTPEAAVEQAVALFRLLGAPGQALDEPWLRRTTVLAYGIDHDPAAGRRQLTARRASGDRRAELVRVTARCRRHRRRPRRARRPAG